MKTTSFALSPQILASQEGLSWTDVSMPHHERTHRWYVIGGVMVLSLALFGSLTRNWSLSVLILIIGGIYYYLRKAQPVLHTIALGQEGFYYDGVYASWKDCRDFWIIKTPGYTELHIWRNTAYPHEVAIHTANIDEKEIVPYISQKLTYRADRHEHLFDVFIRICKL